jgi:hypothetical protein
MKLKNLIKLAFKNFIRDKKNIINILLISITFVFVTVCFSFKESINSYWNESVKKLIDYRTYIVQFDTDRYTMNSAINKLKQQEHIVEAFSPESYLITMKLDDDEILDSNIETNIYLVGAPSNPIKLDLGSPLDLKNNDEYQIICAKQFYPIIEEKADKYLKSRTIDLSNKLNSYLRLSPFDNPEQIKFKIVGLYDAQENHTDGNICYTTLDTVNKLNLKHRSFLFNDPEIINNTLYLITDNVENEELISSTLLPEGFLILKPVLSINKDVGNHIIKIFSVVSITAVILQIVILNFLSIREFLKNKKDYMIMKTCGYSNSDLVLINCLKLVFEFIVSIIISMFFYYIFINLFYNLYIADKTLFYNLKINISYYSMFINTMLIAINCLITSLIISVKMKQMSVIGMIK